MICPMCGREVPERDVTYNWGVAGHYECHRRRQAANLRVNLVVLVCGLLTVGGLIGGMVWFFGEVTRR